MTTVDLSSIIAVDWQPKLGAPGEIVVGVDDVDQCIRSILTTPKGSVPHHPEFGSNLHTFVDWPLQSARPQIIRESIDAIAANEPRVVVSRLSVEQTENGDGLTVEVEWAIAGTTTAGSTQVLVGVRG